MIYSYVVVNGNNQLTDFFSFYNLPSTVIGNSQHSSIKAAYAFYTVPNKHSLLELMKEALVMAKRERFDVFNSLELLEYATVMKELKFGVGDGHLQYYLYNWRTRGMPADQVGLVML